MGYGLKIVFVLPEVQPFRKSRTWRIKTALHAIVSFCIIFVVGGVKMYPKNIDILHRLSTCTVPCSANHLIGSKPINRQQCTDVRMHSAKQDPQNHIRGYDTTIWQGVNLTLTTINKRFQCPSGSFFVPNLDELDAHCVGMIAAILQALYSICDHTSRIISWYSICKNDNIQWRNL